MAARWLRFEPDRAGTATFAAFDWWVGRFGSSGLDGAFGDYDGDGTTDVYWHRTGTLSRRPRTSRPSSGTSVACRPSSGPSSGRARDCSR